MIRVIIYCHFSSNTPFSRDRCVVISKLFISVSNQFLLHSVRLVAMAVINLHFQGGPPLSSSRQSLVGCLSIPFHLLIGNLQLPSGQSAGQGGVYHDGENIMKQSDAEILYKTTTLVMKIMLVV